MSRPRSASLALLVLGVTALAACGSSGGSASATSRGDCPTAPLPIVVSVDQWGDIVQQLAGDCGDVTTVFSSSSADPHDYEPTPGDIAEFDDAKLVVVNGLDYDPWALKAAAGASSEPAVVNGGKVVGLSEGANPHLWYGPDYVDRVAAAVTAELRRLEPGAAPYFEQQHTKWNESMTPYRNEIARIRGAAGGATYGATESVFDYMARAVGLTDVTPSGYQKAAANESEPGPADVNDFQKALADGSIGVLVYNTQTEGAGPEQIRNTAEDHDVPVVEVTESVPPESHTFQAWQVSQLRSLAAALGA